MIYKILMAVLGIVSSLLFITCNFILGGIAVIVFFLVCARAEQIEENNN